MVKNLLRFFSRKSARNDSQSSQLLTYSSLGLLGWHDIKAAQAWRYFAQVSPIARGVGLIANELSSIDFVLENTRTGEVISEYKKELPFTKILKFLNDKANYDKTGTEFKKANVISYLICGEVYILARGVTDTYELFCLDPSEIEVDSDDPFYPSQYVWNNPLTTEKFGRYIDDQKESLIYTSSKNGNQIYQIMDFNPFYKFGNQRGYSRLTSVYYEIEQYIQGNIHNVSTLKKGTRPAGALIVDEMVTNDQVNVLKKQIEAFYAGAANSGNVMVLQGKEFQELSLNNRDMEYSKLNDQVTNRLYNVLEVPASFYDNKASTFNNKLNDRINLYIFAVLPIAARLSEEWTNFLTPRFKRAEDWRVTYLERDIPALEPMFDEANLKKAQSGVFTLNELRQRYGLDDLGTAGDTVYQPLNLVPVGEGGSDMGQATNDKNIIVRDIIKKMQEARFHVKQIEGVKRVIETR